MNTPVPHCLYYSHWHFPRTGCKLIKMYKGGNHLLTYVYKHEKQMSTRDSCNVLLACTPTRKVICGCHAY